MSTKEELLNAFANGYYEGGGRIKYNKDKVRKAFSVWFRDGWSEPFGDNDELEFARRVYDALCVLERHGLIRKITTPAKQLVEEWEKYEQEQEKEKEGGLAE